MEEKNKEFLRNFHRKKLNEITLGGFPLETYGRIPKITSGGFTEICTEISEDAATGFQRKLTLKKVHEKIPEAASEQKFLDGSRKLFPDESWKDP